MKRGFFAKLRMLFSSFFLGMKGGDEIITQNANYGSGEGSEVIQHKEIDSVFSDFLQQKETQRVQETRDTYYRAYKESDKYKVEVSGSFEEGDESDLHATARKKTLADFLKHCDILNLERYEIRTIQENKFIPKKSNFAFDPDDLTAAESEEYVPLFDIERDYFIPRFKLENYANKVVVRKKPDGTYLLDFYTTMYASQFGKVDALFIAELNRIFKDEIRRSDTTDFKEFKFVTDKAFNCDDLCLFDFNEIKFLGINIFDGNFVLTFEAKAVEDGSDITAKYRLKEMDEKYEKKAPRGDGIDLFTIQRHIDKEENNDGDFTSTTFKLS